MEGFSSIDELVAAVALVDIRVWEESAKRLPVNADETENEKSGEQELGFKLAASVKDHGMGFRFRLTIEADRVRYIADVEAVYEVPDDGPAVSKTDRAVVQDFSERVAFMSAYPYIRTLIHAASGRLGASRPVLPLIKQGQVSASEQELTPEEVQETFGVRSDSKSPEQ